MFRILGLLAVTAGAVAQPASPAAAPAAAPRALIQTGERPSLQQRSIEALMGGRVDPVLHIGSALDGRLLQAAREMAAAQRLRTRALLEQWAGEALKDPALAPHLFQVLSARLANAFALWGLDSLGPEHDERLLKALQHPGACYRPQLLPMQGELEARLARLRSLPADELELALADERELLARFGRPRALPPPSQPLALDAQLERMRSGAQRADPPLSPTLRLYFVDLQDDERQTAAGTANLNLRCGIYQWALNAELARNPDPAARRAALSRWREGVRPSFSDVSGLSLEHATKGEVDGPVPTSMRAYGVTGRALLQVEVDAAGKVQQVRALETQLRVRGLPAGERPAVFEDLLARASERRVQAMRFPQQGARRELQVHAELGAFAMIQKILLILLALLSSTAQAASYSSEAYIRRIKEAVWQADFQALDALWREAERETGLDENGDNRFQHFIDETDLPKPEKAALAWYEEWQRVTAAWLKQHPGNVVAVYMAVEAQRQLAWHWRGEGYSGSVTPEGWEGFKRHGAEAQRILLANRALLERSSLLYSPWLLTVKEQGSAEQILPLLREALQRHPRSHKLLFTAMSGVTPRWGGSDQLVDALVAFGVQHTQAQLGQEFYARLYTNAAAVHYWKDLFKASRVRWEPMREGYRQMMQRYEGPRAANRYAMMACMVGDREAWREALGQLAARRQQLNGTLWSVGGARMLYDCQRWAAERPQGNN